MNTAHWNQPRFIGSFSKVEDMPILRNQKGTMLPEIAFAGRSNAGKSTLINMLLQRKGIAKVSNRPGKTIMLNLFEIEQQFSIVDLPGYGYAKVSFQEKKIWEEEIPRYIEQRSSLTTIILVFDIRRSIEPEERLLFELIERNKRIEHCIFVATKSDKLTTHDRKKREHILENEISTIVEAGIRSNLAVTLSTISSTKGDGIGDLRKSVEISLKNSKRDI